MCACVRGRARDLYNYKDIFKLKTKKCMVASNVGIFGNFPKVLQYDCLIIIL